MHIHFGLNKNKIKKRLTVRARVCKRLSTCVPTFSSVYICHTLHSLPQLFLIRRSGRFYLLSGKAVIKPKNQPCSRINILSAREAENFIIPELEHRKSRIDQQICTESPGTQT